MTKVRRYARFELASGERRFGEIADGRAYLYDTAPWDGGQPSGQVVEDVDSEGRTPNARRLAPIEPSKIIGVGRNYRAHASELGNVVPAEPLLFLKPPSSILDPDGAIELPPSNLASRIEHETELGFVVSRRMRRVRPAEALEGVFGFTIVGDVTARDLQKKDGQWTRAKGMDTFCPVGPVVCTSLDPSALRVRCWVSGALRQDGATRDMILTIPEIIAYISESMTLMPGDLVSTGTPSGVGPLVAGDRLEMEVEPIGRLTLRVVGAGDAS